MIAIPPARILLVDDRASDVELFQEALRETGRMIQLDVATSRSEAHEFIARGRVVSGWPWDLVFLDLNLHGELGIDLLDAFQRDDVGRSVPVVVLSASGSSDDVGLAHDAGARAYIRKPLTFNDFVQVLDATLTFWLDVVIRSRRLLV